MNLVFEQWKKNQKNQIERKQLLTLEQSLIIREQLIAQENRFEKLLEDKNNEIKQLKGIIEQSEANPSLIKKTPQKKTNKKTDLNKLYEKIKNNDEDFQYFKRIIEFIQNGYKITDRSDIPTNLITILEVNDIIVPKGRGAYNLTESGKELTKMLFI